MCVPGRRNRRPVTQVFHLHERAADADVGAHLSRVGRPEKECEMTAEADVAKMGVAPGTAAAQFTERRTQTGHR